MAKLKLTEGKDQGREFELGDETVLGRVPETDIQVHDTKASRRHTRISRSGSAYYCEDMGSRNGTQVNDKAITRVKLRDGDVVTIGTTHYLFVDPKSAKAAKSSPATDVTQTMPNQAAARRPAKASAPGAPVIEQRVKKKSFDPSVLERGPRADSGLLFEDFEQRPLAQRMLVYGAGVLVMLLIAGLSYALTMVAIG